MVFPAAHLFLLYGPDLIFFWRMPGLRIITTTIELNKKSFFSILNLNKKGKNKNMTTIDLATIKAFYQANILYELHNASEKIRLFEIKYGCKFDIFEKNIKSKKEENFTEWDDYIEWKAYTDAYPFPVSLFNS